ncbi:DUF421 domain-containing protein [Rhizobacter sp. J219]|uniref:DUF421 domain-containing protein n=1 Tax=Rhizobacter sp. J219 TaxID=2898430 RepID=UPI002151886C|nr:YetF domain-containing protein [Rhizobacter sp. J219]MCR5882518.1 DUF421 domain-containing protein [Rhizobacter sp. J219]
MEELFRLSVSPWELIARGTLIFWFLFAIFRFVMHRDVGSVGLADVLVLVLIADAAQNAMSGGYESVTDGVILISTIVAWNYLLDWGAYRFEWVRRVAEPPPLLLVRSGRIVRQNLRREMMTVDDLMAKLREHGVDDLAQVRKAFMEGDGAVTVIRWRDARPKPAQRQA